MTPLPSLLNFDLARERTRVAARRGAGQRLVRPFPGGETGPSTHGGGILRR